MGDVEKNLNIDTGAEAPISTRMDIFYDLNGSLGFAVGSSGFILAMYFTNWLPYFRYGSLAWIWGCVMYSIPLLLKLKGHGGCLKDSKDDRRYTCPWGIGEFGEFLCYMFYVIGCVLGGVFDDEETVEKFLPVINHMFVYGAFSLALEPVYQVILFLKRRGSCLSRMSATKLCGSSSSSTTTIKDNTDINISSSNDNSDESAAPAPPPPLKLHWDRCFELCAMTFFCAAGIFGGFPPHPSLALPGVYFWEVGSLFSLARSFLMIHKRNSIA